MFNSTTQQITSASNGSNRSSRASNRPSSTLSSAPQLGTTPRADLALTDTLAGNQGHHVQTTYGPVPFPAYANTWNGASVFHEYGPGNAAPGNSSSGGFSTASAFGEPMPPNFQPGQTGGNHYNGYQLAAAAAATNSLSAGYPAYLPGPSPTPVVYTIPNTQGGAASDWRVNSRVVYEARDEVRVLVTVRRSPPA